MNDGLFWVTMGGGSPGDRSRGDGIRHGRATPWPPWALGLKGYMWRLGKSGGRECAGGPEPDTGMHDADVRLDHKAIPNLGWKCGKANRYVSRGLFACTVGPCPLSMQIVSDSLGPFAGSHWSCP
jgi:hypothetical protein